MVEEQQKTGIDAAGRAIAKLSDTAVKEAFGKIFAKDKAPELAKGAIEGDPMLKGLSAWKQTYFATRVALVSQKEDAIGGFNFDLVSGLSIIELSAIFLGLQKAKVSAIKEQYLSTLAAYSRFMAGPPSERKVKPTFGRTGYRSAGMLVIEVEGGGSGKPSEAFYGAKIKGSHWTGINQAVHKTIQNNFLNRELRSLGVPVRVEVIGHQLGSSRVRIPIEKYPGSRMPFYPLDGQAFIWLALYGKKRALVPRTNEDRKKLAQLGAWYVWKQFRSLKLSKLGLQG